MISIDGHLVEPLANGGCYVTTDGVRTFHADQAAAVRSLNRLAGERARYEAQRMVMVGGARR